MGYFGVSPEKATSREERVNNTLRLSLMATALSLAACPAQTPPVDDGAAAKTTPQGDEMNTAAREFAAQCKNHLDEAQRALEKIFEADDGLEVLEQYNRLSIQIDNALARSSLVANTHPDKDMRETAEKCEQDVSQYATELSLNRKLYEALAGVDASKLDPLAKRLVEKEVRDFKRSGVDKDAETRDKIKKLKEELVQIGQDFGRNLREDVRYIELDGPEDLAGLPKDYIAAHKPGENGKIRVTTDYPDYIPFMNYAKNDEARKKLYMLDKNRGYPKNIEVLDALIAKRYELAQLLGYDHWADYITEDKMIKNAAAVDEFVDEVDKIARPRAERELTMLLERKRRDHKDAKTINDWEKGYYEELVKTEKFNFDSQEVRPYFEYSQVKQGLLDLTAELFGIRYVKVEDADVWHPSVEVYDVVDNGDKKLGRIYLDMHPRENKYKHAAQFTLRSGVEGQQQPEGVLVCNFPNPETSEGPALMVHDQVVTFFHEFGHLLHHTLGGHQPWLRFSGVATEWDFVEAPSQFFEEWAWDADVLQRFAKHYETGEPIPAELVNRMREADEFGLGLWATQQMFYTAISLHYYDQDPQNFDTTKLLEKLQKRYGMFPYVDDTHFQTNFGHLDGYSAMYYTYMWSRVIAKDLLSPFKANGMLDRDTSMKYRKTVLDPGGTKDADELVEDFLGREYSFESFHAWLEGKDG